MIPSLQLMNTKPIYVTHEDKKRLQNLLAGLPQSQDIGSTANQLRSELDRATVVDKSAMPEDTVTLHSYVKVRDLETGEIDEYTLTLPENANPERNMLSILAPVGTGLLGYSTGDEVRWQTPGGERVLKIEHVEHRAPQSSPVAAYFPADLLG